MVVSTVFCSSFSCHAPGLLWFITFLVPSSTTHDFHHRKEVLTTIGPTTLTEKGAAKRRRVPTIAIAVAALAALVLIGILVYPSSPLKALFINTNSEVIVAPNDGKQSVTLGALFPLSGALSSLGESEAHMRYNIHTLGCRMCESYFLAIGTNESGIFYSRLLNFFQPMIP